MISKIRRKGMKRKYKRLMAAALGAAVLSSAMLPGVPAIKVEASGDPAAADNPIAVSQAGAARSQSGDRVQAVGDNQKAGKRVITTVRPTRDSEHPATYGQSGILHFRRVARNPVVTAKQQMLYQSDKFSGWHWYENSYPLDMVFGVLLIDPRPDGGVGAPDNPLNPIKDVDFSRQFVLYAHLGSVASQGYGIGVTKVVQTGNDITVMVNTKSPLPNEALATSKTDDFVTLDRGTLDFSRAIKITFIGPDGNVLSSQTVTPG